MSVTESKIQLSEKERFNALVQIASGLAASGDFTYTRPYPTGCPNGVACSELIRAANEILNDLEEMKQL